LLGWESPTYGELTPTISLVYRVQALLPVRIVTAIAASEDIQLQQSEGLLIFSRDARRICEVNLLPAAI
jgi:hypothetical protein